MLEKVTEQKARCRGCRVLLEAKPYGMIGSQTPTSPATNEPCKVNFYGGYVCSKVCDYRASLEHEQSMPGHSDKDEYIGVFAQKHFDKNWK